MPKLCSQCETSDHCPHGHHPPPPCPDFIWDGCYSAREEADMAEDDG